jgi:hypothetical protein
LTEEQRKATDELARVESEKGGGKPRRKAKGTKRRKGDACQA